MTHLNSIRFNKTYIAVIYAVITIVLGLNLWLFFSPSSIELKLAHWLQFGHPDWLNLIAIQVTDSYVFIALLTGIMCIAGILYKKYVTSIMLAIALSSLLLIDPLKQIFQRPRPSMEQPIIDYISGTSFPSGHALTATILTGALYLAYTVECRGGKKISIAAASIYIMLVSWSRIYLNVHYPSDVIGGVLIGLAIIMALRLLYKQLRRSIVS